MYVMTDDYKEEDGQYKKAAKMKSLSYTCDLPETVTVPANGEKKISLTVKLDAKETAKNMEIFSNGFFVDGYVVLDSKESAQPQISIPYTGFYGDWTKTSILDGNYYGEHRLAGNYLFSCTPESYIILGTNSYIEDGQYDSEDYVGFSPNGDGIFDEFCVMMSYLRDVGSVTCDIRNKNNEIISHVTLIGNTTTKYVNNTYSSWMGNQLIEEGKMPSEEGDYTATISAALAYGWEKTEEVTLKFYIDTTAPEFGETEIVREDGKTYLKVQATDNKYLMGADVYDMETGGNEYYAENYIEPGEKGSTMIDVTGQDLSKLAVEIRDYAGNATAEEINDLIKTADETPSASPSASSATASAVVSTVSPTIAPTASLSASPTIAPTASSAASPTIAPAASQTVSSSAAPKATEKPVNTANNAAAKKIGRGKIKSAKNNKKKSIRIRLSKVKNANEYMIYYATNKKFKKAGRVTTKKLSYTLKKLKKGKTYYIRVRALRGTKTGKWSKTKKVKVKK
jgi:hypothetical protein